MGTVMSSQQRHLCGDCYRTIEPLAREGYWRRHPLGANRDRSPLLS
jgi:hypothetical protein